MTDLYFWFPSEESSLPLLFESSGDDVRSRFRAFDVIGVLYDADGKPLPGWHVNVRLVDGEDGSALEPFRVYPETPSRVWADTVFPDVPSFAPGEQPPPPEAPAEEPEA